MVREVNKKSKKVKKGTRKVEMTRSEEEREK